MDETLLRLLIALLAAAAGWAVATGGRVPRDKKAPAETKASEIDCYADQSAERLGRENEKLKSELRHQATILNLLPFPVWRRGADMAVKYCNLAYSEAAEESPEKTVDSEGLELHRGSRALAAQARAGGTPKTERRHVVVGGERRLYHLTEIPVPESEELVGFAIDITELEVAQEEMRRHISAQADLLESSTSAMAIYGADTRLKSYNYAFVALWGLDEHWLDSEPGYGEILEVLREKRKLPEQANFPAFKQQQLRQFTDLIEPREEFFYLPDGKTLRVIAIPHALGGVLFAYEDVTDRLALERSYNTLIAVQKATLDHLQEGVVVYGEDGRMQLNNPVFRQMWRMPEDVGAAQPRMADLIDHTRHFYGVENWDEFKRGMLDSAHARTPSYRRLERTDGSVVDRTTVPLPDGATLITYSDVTDSTLVERSLRERNEALQEADRLKSEFLANVSYELRSPLTSITGFSDMLRQQYFGELSAKQREYVDGIHQSAHHLSNLISNILDLASIEAGYLRLEVTRFPIHEMLHSVFSLVQERAKEKKIELALESSASAGQMEGDETRIKQVLFNLLSNALKYTDTGGSITLGSSATESEISFWVEDNGTGIPPEEHQAIFASFYRAKSGAARAGTGLGLSIVKSFIELHGGRVELASNPGTGTLVTVHLPRRHGAAATAGIAQDIVK